MIDHGLDRLIDDVNCLNDEVEQFIDEIKHMSMEEDKIDEISNEVWHYDG